MTDVEAVERLRAMGEAGWYWHAARGRLTDDEPMYGVGLYRPDANGDEMEIVGEGDTLGDAVSALLKALAERVKN